MALKRPQPELNIALPIDSEVSITKDDDEIINLRVPKKPRIEFRREEFTFSTTSITEGAFDLRNRLNVFLPTLKAADEQLEREKLAGRIAERRIEIYSSDDEDGEEEDDDGSVDLTDDSDPEDDSEGEGLSEIDNDSQNAPPPPNITEILISNLLGQSPNTAENDTAPLTKKRKRRKKNARPYIEMNLGLGVLEELKPLDGDDDKDENDRRELISRILELRRLQESQENADDDEPNIISLHKQPETEFVVTGEPAESHKTLKGLPSSSKETKKVVIEELN